MTITKESGKETGMTITKDHLLEAVNSWKKRLHPGGYYDDWEPWDERCYEAILSVLDEATKPKVVSKEDFDEWAYELRGWMDTDGIKTILRNHLRELGIAVADDGEGEEP